MSEELRDKKTALEIAELNWKVKKAEDESYFLRNHRDTHDREATVACLRGEIDGIALQRLSDVMREWRHDFTGKDHLIIEVTSPGGSVWSGFGAYDVVSSAVDSGLKIEIVVQGYAASMASAFLQAAETRSITEHSWLMIHEAGYVSQTFSQTSEMRDQLELIETLQTRLFKMYTDRCTLTADELSEKTRRKSWWLDAQEALKWGFVDRII